MIIAELATGTRRELLICHQSIAGKLDLSHLHASAALCFVDCDFAQPLILREARLESLLLSGCKLPELEATGLRLNGDLQLCGGTIVNIVRVAEAQLAGNLSCAATMRGDAAVALDARHAAIAGHAILSNGIHAYGAVDLTRAQIGGMLYCSHGRFDQPGGAALTLDHAAIGGNAILSNDFKASGAVRLRQATIGGQLYCAHGSFDNAGEVALDADGVIVGGRVFLGDWFSAKGAMRLRDAQITGDLHCVGGNFQNPGAAALDASRAAIGGGVRMNQRFLAQGAVILDDAAIAETLNCTNGRFDNPGAVALSAQRARVGRNLLLGSGFEARGAVSLRDLHAGGAIDLEYAICDRLDDAGLVVG